MDPLESSTSTLTVLKNIVPAADNNINTKFILLEKGKVTIDSSRHRHHQKTCLALVADETASVHFQLWGDECHAFLEGDIILLSNGIFSNSNRPRPHQSFTLRAGQKGKIEKIGEFTMPFVETPNLSEIHWVPDASTSTKYVNHSVVSPYSRIFSRSQQQHY